MEVHSSTNVMDPFSFTRAAIQIALYIFSECFTVFYDKGNATEINDTTILRTWWNIPLITSEKNFITVKILINVELLKARH